VGYILCHEKKAQTPYYIEAAGIQIWTIEELCYYVCQYIWLLDNNFLSEELCAWINTELQMPKLAKPLYAEYYRGRSLKGFLEILLNNTGYCSKAEIYQLAKLLDGMEHVTEMERLKQKGDYFLKDQKYRRAIGMYNRILTMRRNIDLPQDFYGKVWNNKGMAYAKLFLFEEAVSCMKRAWEENNTDAARKAYLGALYLAVPRHEFQERAREEEIPQEAVYEFLMRADAIMPDKYYQSAGNLKKEYGRDNV